MRAKAPDQCDRSRCNGAAHVRYLGYILCARCWLEFCKRELKSDDIKRFIARAETRPADLARVDG